MKMHLLVVDDCPNITLMLQTIVDRFFQPDLELTVAYTLEDALAVLLENPPHAILLDYGLRPHEDCGPAMSAIRSAHFNGPIHLWSNHDADTVKRHPAAAHTTAFYQKQDFVGMRLKTLLCDHLFAAQPGVCDAVLRRA